MSVPEFHADDWFTVSGRGPVAVIRDHGYDDPRELVGQVVLIDGEGYRVTAVETHAVLGSHRGRPVGLLVEEESAPPGAVRAWLLEPDGTPTGEAWWDRKLRIDGRFEYAPLGARDHRILVNLLGGLDRSWQQLYDHLTDPDPRWPHLVQHPVALEAWTYVEAFEETPWMHVLLPRVDVDDVGERPTAGGWPVWTWVARPNPNWPDGGKATESAIVWRRYDTPPTDPLIPLGLTGVDDDLPQVVVSGTVQLTTTGDQP